jgi:NADH/F420H2 dehydrogenase subunit C
VDLSVRGAAQPATPEGASAAPSAPSLLAYDRDHLNALLTQIGALEQRLGVPLPKSRLAQGLVSLEVPSDKLLEVVQLLRDVVGFEMLTCVTAVDMVDHLQSIYHFRSLANNWLLQVRVRLTSDHPEVDSLVSLYPSANWLEREQYDLLGVVYRGHPDLRRILLEDEFVGHPLLKSFQTTPRVRHDPATTQTPAVHAISGEQLRRQERVQTKRLGQGSLERIHPGMTTFGGAAVYLTTGQGVAPAGEASGETPPTPSRYLSGALGVPEGTGELSDNETPAPQSPTKTPLPPNTPSEAAGASKPPTPPQR